MKWRRIDKLHWPALKDIQLWYLAPNKIFVPVYAYLDYGNLKILDSLLLLAPCLNCGGPILKKTALASLFYKSLKIKKQLIKHLYTSYAVKLISWANIVLKSFCLNYFPQEVNLLQTFSSRRQFSVDRRFSGFRFPILTSGMKQRKK